MKKLLLTVLILTLFFNTSLTAQAQERNWWPEQIDEWDEYHNVEVVGKWPGDVLCNEICIDTITFRPIVMSAKCYSRSTKIKLDTTTAARVIVVQYTTDGQHYKQQSFRNAAYNGPVTCVRKWQ